MKKNIVPLLAIAFVVAVISTAIFYGLFARKLSNNSGNLPRQNVVVAARKLSIGAVLAVSDVRVAEIRGSTAFGNAFTKPEQVIGSTLLEPIEANQALTKGALLSRDATENGTVPTGMRAITIHVLESGGSFRCYIPAAEWIFRPFRTETVHPMRRSRGCGRFSKMLRCFPLLLSQSRWPFISWPRR